MIKKCNYLRIVASVIVMVLGLTSTWAVEIVHKDGLIRQDKFEREGSLANCSWNVNTGKYDWKNSSNNLLKSTSLTWNTRDLSGFDYIMVQTENLSGEARVVVTINDNGRDHSYAHFVNASGVFKIPLANELWLDLNSYSPVTMDKNTMLKKVKSIKFGGNSGSGSVILREIALAKHVRDVEWDQNGYIQLEYSDIYGDTYWTRRNGDFIEKTDAVQTGNNNHWATFAASFGECLETRSVRFNGKVYDGQNNLIKNLVVNNISGYQYKDPSLLNGDIAIGQLTDVQLMLYGTGSMHLYSVLIKHKDVKTVSFDSDGGTPCESMDYFHTAITLPEPMKSNNRFDGWYNGTTKVGNAGDSYSPTSDVTLVARWADSELPETEIGNLEKDYEVNEKFSRSYRITNNHQRIFRFKNQRIISSHAGVMTANWSLWTADQARDAETKSQYFHLDMEPSSKRYETPESLVVQTNKFYKRTGDKLDVLVPMTESMYGDFLYDMRGADVSVVVGNYDGKIRVYAIMTGVETGRSYVYPYDYTKYVVNGTTTGDIYAYFTVDHTWLTNFSASLEMPLALLDYHVEYPDNTQGIDKSCTVTMATEEGYPLVPGTKVGLQDKVVYKANTGLGWEFDVWGQSANRENPRTVRITESHIAAGIADPTATFKKNGTSFDFATNRLVFFDFENMSNSDLLSGDEAPTGTTYPEDKAGKFYNYGDRGRIYHDPVFGGYYQNLAVGTNEFTVSKSQNFLRYVFREEDKVAFDQNMQKEATIGFWVNGSLAIDYELPLERGSMFSFFSNDCFSKADEKPRYMFDIACNGWIYSYMPNTPPDGKDYVNKYFYGEDAAVVDNPKPSLFGVQNYKHTQDQRQHKFYDDRNWHYVTYVASDSLKYVTMYLDGVKTGELDTRNLGDKYSYYDPNGSYGRRVYYLRSLVLGGFTPHGMFFGQQYYSDAALAYDDISVYSIALTPEQIKAIYDEKMKNKTRYEWHFVDELKSNNGVDKVDFSGWSQLGNNVFQKSLGSTQSLTSNNVEIPATKGLKFSGDVQINRETGLLGLEQNAKVYLYDVPWEYTVRFIAKRKDGNAYSQVNLFPEGVRYYRGGVIRCNTDEMDGFAIDTSNRCRGGKTDSETYFNARASVWISDIIITPYDMNYSFHNKTVDDAAASAYTRYQSCDYVELKVQHTANGIQYNNKAITGTGLPDGAWSGWSPNYNLPRFDYYYMCRPATPNYNQNGTAPYVKFSSSSSQVANVNSQGQVTLTGLPGTAIIKAVLVQNNLQDSLIYASYKIVVTDETNTNRLVANSNVEVGTVHTTANTKSNVIVTTGGWAYNGGSYASGSNNVTDGWGTASYNYSAANDPNPVDGFTVVAQGQQDAHSESYGLNGGSGRFSPAASATDGLNQKPWTLPCRGAYIKVQPQKAGVMSVYVLQNGNLGDEKEEGDAKHCTSVSWRPVYVADETGRVLTDIYVTSNSKISQNDNFFREGRRRAQFIETEHETWNQKLRESMEEMDATRLGTLIKHWTNAGWKQEIISSGDGGHMIMSKGIVRYTFNVSPGKTYYIFSNDTKVGYSGYNFEEGKCLTKVNGVFTMSTVTSGTVTFNDADYGKKTNGEIVNPSYPEGFTSGVAAVTYNRTFTPGKWGSICLPFSMNNKQMKENFGDETSVVLLKGIDDKGVVQMVWHVNQDIIAGYPYFILPRGKESITQIKTNAYFDPTVKAPSFVIGPEMDNGQSATYGSIELLLGAVRTTEYPYVFKGNFATEQATAGSYVMTTSGVLTKASNTPNIKPFRAYLRYCSQIDASSGDHANGKPLTGMGYMNSDGEEVTTSIEQILEANGIFVDSANVYGIDGQVKRYNTHDLNGLPKGIYIVNGKKYVVK